MIVHGYTESGAIEAEIGGAHMFVPDDMGNRHRQMIAEWEAEGNVIPAYVPPLPPPLTRLYKSSFIRRMSASEAETMEGVLNAENAYLRMLYHSVEYFDMTDGLITYLHFVLADQFGENRANELLEPEV